MKTFLIVLVCGLISTFAQAQKYAIVGATVHTMTDAGTLENATVLVSDGQIQAVMTEQPALAGFEVIDAKGKVVTPGLIGAYTSLGLVEVGLSAGTVDSTSKYLSLSKTGAALNVAYGVNPDSTLIQVSRVAGITSAATAMANTNQLFQGQGAVITLGDSAEPVIKSAAFVATSVSNGGADDVGGSRASLWVALETALDEAEFSLTQKLTPRIAWHGLTSKADAQALQPVVEGKVPLVVDARRLADIRQVLALKKRRPKLHIVLLRGTEAWRLADELAAAQVPVILDPESNLPFSFEQLAATLKNATRLHEAGVTIAIGMGSHNIRLARQNAGNAVANGLPWQAGLAALTVNPANIFGLADSLGTLEQGKQADLVMWSGDPLEVTETAELVFIQGRKINMESRHTKLRDRYLTLQQNKPMPYVRP